jgi:hypothetical protein
MPKQSTGSPKTNLVKLEHSMAEFTGALIEHSEYLEKHIQAMECLTQTLKQLDATIKKEISLENNQPSIELREAITSFLEYTINPKYYKDTGYLKLPVASERRHPEATKKNRHPKPN